MHEGVVTQLVLFVPRYKKKTADQITKSTDLISLYPEIVSIISDIVNI